MPQCEYMLRNGNRCRRVIIHKTTKGCVYLCYQHQLDEFKNPLPLPSDRREISDDTNKNNVRLKKSSILSIQPAMQQFVKKLTHPGFVIGFHAQLLILLESANIKQIKCKSDRIRAANKLRQCTQNLLAEYLDIVPENIVLDCVGSKNWFLLSSPSVCTKKICFKMVTLAKKVSKITACDKENLSIYQIALIGNEIRQTFMRKHLTRKY